MEIILKKTFWFSIIITLCLVIVILFAASGCDKSETPLKTCDFEDPLTNLPWLKAKIDEITLLFQTNPLHITIYQCIYGNGETGFLEDRGNVAFFYNCEGETLCIMGGDAGAMCSDLNINYENKKLIWEKEENVQQPCYCIMDTLKGEWSWYKTYTAKHGLIDNEYKSIIKIFNQNEDATVNYEVFVDDTLFYKGNFQFQYDQWHNGIANIEFPHDNHNIINNWLILFGDIEGKPSKDILCFFSGADDDNKYFYQKIK